MEEVTEKKHKISKKFIAVFCCTFVVISLFVTTILFLLPSGKDNSSTSSPSTNRYFLAQASIISKEFSNNFNGTYEFSYVNFAELKEFNNSELSEIYAYYKVGSTMELLTALTKQKKTEILENSEVLIISNDTFSINHNKNIFIYGNIYGNDDYSILFDNNSNEIASVSLTKLSISELQKLNSKNKTSYNEADNSLFIRKKESIIINNNTYEFYLTYVYKLKSQII